jgi:photosystem II stability/assembly factor-like uncharacterized protein
MSSIQAEITTPFKNTLMMKNIYLLFITLFLSVTVNAQWAAVPPVCASQLLACSFADPSTVYAGGVFNSDTSTLLKSTNGGVSFYHLDASFLTPQTKQIFSVLFTGTNTGYIASNDSFQGTGSVYRTTDGGLSWTQVLRCPAGVILQDLTFPNAKVGYTFGLSFPAGGTIVYKTTDSGKSWSSIFSSPNVNIRNCYFFDDSTGLLLGSGWDSLGSTARCLAVRHGAVYDSSRFNTYQTFDAVGFISPTVGFACARDTGIHILKTTNGGTTWLPVFDVPTGTYFSCRHIRFPTNKYGYAVGGGTNYMTADGGNSWNPFMPADPILDITFSHDIGIAVCDTGHIFRNPLVTAVPTIAAQRSVQIYPNPANGIFNLQMDSNRTGNKIIVTNYLGQTVLQKEIATSPMQMDIRTQPDGVYIIRIIDEHGATLSSEKLVKIQ